MKTEPKPLTGLRLIRAAISIQGYLDIPNGGSKLRVSSVIVQNGRWIIDGGPGRLMKVTAQGKRSLIRAAERTVADRDAIEAKQIAGAAAAMLR